MQVEVNVQSYWDDPSQSDGEPLNPQLVIPTETWETWFQQWLRLLQQTATGNQTTTDLTPGCELTLRLTNDTEIQGLNAQYRQLNQPTDVLAFAALEVDYPQLQSPIPSPIYLGDIVISIDTAQRQAQQQGHNLTYELVWLAAHGLLHLLGWDHPTEEHLHQMLAQQEKLLQSIGLVTLGEISL